MSYYRCRNAIMYTENCNSIFFFLLSYPYYCSNTLSYIPLYCSHQRETPTPTSNKYCVTCCYHGDLSHFIFGLLLLLLSSLFFLYFISSLLLLFNSAVSEILILCPKRKFVGSNSKSKNQKKKKKKKTKTKNKNKKREIIVFFSFFLLFYFFLVPISLNFVHLCVYCVFFIARKIYIPT